MEVFRCVNYVLISVIKLIYINVELVSIIIMILCRCQMFQAYDGILLIQVVILLVDDSCVSYICMS